MEWIPIDGLHLFSRSDVPQSARIVLNFPDRGATVPEAATRSGFTALAFFWAERRGSSLVAPSCNCERVGYAT